MNLGGTEKSFLNLLDNLPKDSEIDLLVIAKQGELMDKISPNINVFIIENHHIFADYIKLGSLRFRLQ